MKKILLLLAFLVIVSSAMSQLKISTFGDVGIGMTTAPTQKLEVLGNTRMNGNLEISGLLGIGTNNPVQKLHIAGNTFVSGNIGIGSYSSTEKLQVEGTVRIKAWTDIIFDWTGDWGWPVMYPSYNQRLQLGKSDLRLGNIWTVCVNSITQPTSSSDERTKENIVHLENPIEKIKQISGYNYNFKRDIFPEDIPEEFVSALTNKQIGFLAQEVEKVFPELVTHPKSEDEFCSLNYNGVIPILLEAIKEQQSMIENLQKEFPKTGESVEKTVINNELLQEIEFLKQEVAYFKEILSVCCNINQKKSTEKEKSNIIQEFSLTETIVSHFEELKVYQNVPNPFHETTHIQCYIPQEVQKAELCVYNIHGVQAKCLTVSERGNITIQIQAGQLTAGVYTYLLIGDKKTSDAKQMILTK